MCAFVINSSYFDDVIMSSKVREPETLQSRALCNRNSFASGATVAINFRR
jgi:hypothetical protein